MTSLAPRSRRLALSAWLVALLLMLPEPARAASPDTVVLGSDQEAVSVTGIWMRRIYAEAFRRLGIPIEFAVYPTKRLSTTLDEGGIDGEFVRVHAYAAAHPNLVRVEEPVFSVQFALFTAHPALRLDRLSDLPATPWVGALRRGVGVCENTLKPLLPSERLSEVTTPEQGLNLLLVQRIAFLCEIDLAMWAVQQSAEYKGVTGIRVLLPLGEPVPLYPYLHRKRAELATPLAATLKQMKAEGLIERYRREAAKGFSAK